MMASCSPWIVATMSRHPSRACSLERSKKRARASHLKVVRDARSVGLRGTRFPGAARPFCVCALSV